LLCRFFYTAPAAPMYYSLSLHDALPIYNVGLMWVAVELATLTTVLMVGIYRTPAALEAAWKYFLLGSVGIALALFGTILVYLARSEEHTSELQSQSNLVCRLLLEKNNPD